MEQKQKSERCQHCNIKCGLLKVSPEVLRTLEDEFEKLSKSKSNSLLKKYLTKEIFDQNKHKVSSYGSNLLDCAQSGFANYDSSIGLYAPDPEAYAMFASLFNPIIQEYHIGFTAEDKHPKLNWGNLVELEDLDPSGDHIISTRVRCGRSIEGYPFNPLMTETHYREIETKMITIFDGFTDDFAGTYRSLIHMSKNEQHELIDSHYLFREGDKFLRSAGACRFWPLGRGIFLNEAKTFVVWVNEEDHLRIISMEPGGNLLAVYKRMIDGVQAIEKSVKFSRSSKLGFLTFCPTNLGTTLRASVHIKIPKLAANMDRLESVARRYHLQIRGTRGEHTETEGGIYDISNKRRLGITEAEAIQEMHEGISEIIRMEESLE